MSLRTALRLVSGSIVLSLLLGVQVYAQEPGIAVIIDDVGNDLSAGRRSIALPGPVVLAVLPHTPYAHRLSEEAAATGKEILLHMPMQPSDASADPGPGTLHLSQDSKAIDDVLSAAIAAVPLASGVSNHMGSLLTRDLRSMRVFMQSLRDHDRLFFIDSYTTHLSVALMTAREFGIPALKRDVFIDAHQDAAAIAGAWQRLLEQARTSGFAVGIAHPHPQTLAFLEQHIAELTDVKLVTLQELITAGSHAQQSYAETIGYAPIGDFVLRDRVH